MKYDLRNLIESAYICMYGEQVEPPKDDTPIPTVPDAPIVIPPDSDDPWGGIGPDGEPWGPDNGGVWDENLQQWVDPDWYEYWYGEPNQNKLRQRQEDEEERQRQRDLEPEPSFPYGPIPSDDSPYIPNWLEDWLDSFLDGLRRHPWLGEGKQYELSNIDKLIVEMVNNLYEAGGPFEWDDDEIVSPFHLRPAGMPAPGAIALIVLALWVAGMSMAAIAALLGIPIAVVAAIIGSHSPPAPTSNPSSKPRGEPTDGGSTPTGIWPPQKWA